MNIVVGVLYKGVEPFLDEYFASLDADVWIFNNHEDPTYSPQVPGKLIDIPGRPLPISAMRQFMVEYLNKHELSKIVFSDCDDIFGKNRINDSFAALDTADIVFNDIPPFFLEVEFNPSPFTFRPVSTLTFTDLLDYNQIGFLNSAIRGSVLKDAFPIITDTTSAVNDWFLFAGLLSQGYTATFIPCVTHYRQHNNNTVGMKRKFTKEDILFGINVKKNQYTKLLVHLSGTNRELVEGRLAKVLVLEKELENGMEAYLINVNNEKKLFYWWEWIDESYSKSSNENN